MSRSKIHTVQYMVESQSPNSPPNRTNLCTCTVHVLVPTVVLVHYLLEYSDEHLVAEVALGGLRVGVDDERVRDLEPVGHLNIHPNGTT